MLIEAGQTLTTKVDLSLAYEFAEVGKYTVALHAQVLDVQDGVGRTEAEKRRPHQFVGFPLPVLKQSFYIVSGTEPRHTLGENARRQMERPETPRPRLSKSRMRTIVPKVPSFIGGTAARQDTVRVAHVNAANCAAEAYRELLTFGIGMQHLFEKWFGELGTWEWLTTRLPRVREVYRIVSNATLWDDFTYDLTNKGCQSDWAAYTYPDCRKVWMCSDFFDLEQASGEMSQLGVVLHEFTHAVAKTKDTAYWSEDCLELAKNKALEATNNADSYRLFTQDYAAELITAASVWNSEKAYFFVAGQYYKYDLERMEVFLDYPKSISEGWPGLWQDRIDAVVTAKNGKAYFFKGSEYMRCETVTKRFDTGFPRSIRDDWPGLWWNGIDAAIVNSTGRLITFFKYDLYMVFDVDLWRVVDGPKSIAETWPGVWRGKIIDTAFEWENDVFFFMGYEFVRFDCATHEVTDPKRITNYWRGLP